MRKIGLLLAVLVVALAACSKEEELTPTATVAGTPAATELPLQPADLLADPAAHEGQPVQISGRYSRLPAPFCNGVLYLSPATWALSDSGMVIQAAGLEELLEPLVPDGLTMTVDGRWEVWVGPLGCGEGAVISQVWYLHANRVLFPNPLSRATLTPLGVDTIEWPTPPPTSTLTLTVPAGSPLPTVARLTSTVPPTAVPTRTPTASHTPTALFSPLPTATEGRLPTLSPPASPTLIPSATPWPTFTPLSTHTSTPPVTLSPTTEAETETPSPTPTAAMSDQGELDVDDVVNGVLASDETHSWLFSATAGDVVTLTVGPTAGLDLELTLRDPQGIKVERQNAGLAGESESIAGLTLEQDGDYQILVEQVNGVGGDYGLALMDDFSLPILFPGNLNYGEDISVTLPLDTARIWHFQGSAEDTVTIYLEMDGDTDLFFALFGPDMETALAEVDEGLDGVAEEITITLPEDSFYSIWVEDNWFGDVGYQLSVTLEE